MTAEVTQHGALDMQVCVPSDWTDEQVLAFAEREYPCGTEHGWSIRRGGSVGLAGCAERVACSLLATRVHIMLDA